MLSNGETGTPKKKSKAAPKGYYTVNPTSINVPTDDNNQPIAYQFQEYPKYIREADSGDGQSECVARDAAHEAQIRARLAPVSAETDVEAVAAALDAAEPVVVRKKPGPKPKVAA